jgi:pimeloyl-ACP methyl ester carboxylesterase
MTKKMSLAGTALELVERGKGRPLLFLHAGEGLAPERPWLALLSQRFRVIAPWHPGYGNSPLMDGSGSVDDLAYLYLDLAAELKLDNAVLVGACFGGWIAAEMMVRSTAGFSHLVLVDPLGIKISGREERDITDMHEATFRIRRGIQPLGCCSGSIKGYRLRFNLDGRPRGRSAPANLYPDPDGEVWGVLYRMTRRDLIWLDMTEGVPGRGYHHVEIEAQDRNRRVIQAVTYIADGKEVDGKPSLRYITLIREGARAHRLPKTYIRFLEAVEHAE